MTEVEGIRTRRGSPRRVVIGKEDRMPIPIPLDYVIERLRIENEDIERRNLRALTGISLTGEEARSIWPRILEHKWYMSERMGRDVGLRVAAVDFFEYVQPPPRRVWGAARVAARVRPVGHALFADPVLSL